MITINFFDGFTIVNFLYLVVIIGYLVNRYIVPSLYDAHTKDEKNIDAFKQEYRRLAQEKEAIERERKAQNKQGIWLLEKIKLWSQVVKNKDDQEEARLRHSQKVMKTYLEEQAENLSLQHIKDEVAPEALDHTMGRLKELFKDKKQQEMFLNEALTTLRKRTS